MNYGRVRWSSWLVGQRMPERLASTSRSCVALWERRVNPTREEMEEKVARVVVAREFIMLRIPCDTFLRARYVCILSFRPRLENVNPATGTVSFSSRNSLARSPLPFSVCPPFTLADKPHRPVVSRQLAEQQTTRGIFERVLHTLPSIASHLHALRNRSVADGSRGRERDDWGGKFCSLVT